MWPAVGGMHMGMGWGTEGRHSEMGGVAGGDGGMWPAMGGMHMGMGWGAGCGMGASSGSVDAQPGSTPDDHVHGLQESLRMDASAEQENRHANTKKIIAKYVYSCKHNRLRAQCKDCRGSQM
jgi:hypothetical protein